MSFSTSFEAYYDDNDDGVEAVANSVVIITFSAFVINLLFSVINFSAFVYIVYMLKTKTRKRIKILTKKFKFCQRRIRDNLSPTAEQFLAVCAHAGISKDQVLKRYAEYDMRRRKMTTKYMHYDDPDVAQMKVFQKFFSESYFIKGGGFRMHRLLHELAAPPPASVTQIVRTVLAPAFK